MLDDFIRQCLAEFNELGIPRYTRRQVEIPLIKNMVTTIVGARKTGKTFLTYQIIGTYVEEKIIESLRKVCYLHFDDERLLELRAEELHRIDALFLEMSRSTVQDPLLFVFDEIHRVKGWEYFALRLSRNPNWHVVVTGSSSELEEDKIGRQLRGKTVTVRLFPLSFQEYLRFCGVLYDKKSLTVSKIAEIKRTFAEYLSVGSFPAMPAIPQSQRGEILQQYFNAIVAADFLEKHKINHPQTCKLFLRSLLQKNACPYTHTKELHSLASIGHKVVPLDIANWFAWACEAFFIGAVTIDSSSIKKREQNYRKVYAVDWALANRVTFSQESRISRVLESIVYWHLRRKNAAVSYDLAGTQKFEVDFLAGQTGQQPQEALQVCADLSDPDTAERETRSLDLIRKKYPRIDPCIITRHAPMEGAHLAYPVREAWRWLLDV